MSESQAELIERYRQKAVTNRDIEKANEERVPEWFGAYTENLKGQSADLVKEVEDLSTLKLEQVNERLGGNIDELPYKFLKTLFVNGTDDPRIGQLLSGKREKYLVTHPEEKKTTSQEGISGFDGRVWTMEQWNKMSLSERQGVLVGSTCFHYESGTPGMSSNPEDFWNL